MTHLGIYADATFPNAKGRTIGLWQGGSLVTSVTFIANDSTGVDHESCCGRGYAYLKVDTPVVLSGTYTIGAYYEGGNGPGTFCPTSGPSYASGITHIANLSVNGGLSEPTGNLGTCPPVNGAMVGPNFRLKDD